MLYHAAHPTLKILWKLSEGDFSIITMYESENAGTACHSTHVAQGGISNLLDMADLQDMLAEEVRLVIWDTYRVDVEWQLGWKRALE